MRPRITIFCLLLTAVSASAQINAAIAMPPDRAQDSYQIYSMLLPGEPFNQMPSNLTGRWAIAQVTVNYEDMNPRLEPLAQLKAPPGNEKIFHEAEHDYQTNKYIRVKLTSEPLRVNHSFTLLEPPAVDELREAKSSAIADSSIRSKWAAYPGITFFSEVYFNPKRTAALVYMNNWCSSLCASGTWVYLEKQNGSWVRRSGIIVPGA